MNKTEIKIKTGKENCDHDWVYSNQMLTSMPPQVDKICRKCGKIGRDTLGGQIFDEYSEVVEKFRKKEKLLDGEE